VAKKMQGQMGDFGLWTWSSSVRKVAASQLKPNS
jgi:hypothetical protein